MDPISIFGAVSAVGTMIEGLDSVVDTLRQLHAHWKDADFVVQALESELGALKAALVQIRECIGSLAESHYQLTMDVESSLSC